MNHHNPKDKDYVGAQFLIIGNLRWIRLTGAAM